METIGSQEVARLAETFLNYALHAERLGDTATARAHAQRAVAYRSELRRRAA